MTETELPFVTKLMPTPKIQIASIMETIPEDAIPVEEPVEKPEPKKKDTVRDTYHMDRNMFFLGDSRTVGMYAAVTKRSTGDGTIQTIDGNGYAWSGKVGAGMQWMKSTGEWFINPAVGENSSVVILMGVNDMSDDTITATYVDYVNQKAAEWAYSGAETYFVSVNPVKGPINGVTNEKIDAFNENMRANLDPSIYYIETNKSLAGEFEYNDRLHYNEATYLKIYEQILYEVQTRYSDNDLPLAVENR